MGDVPEWMRWGLLGVKPPSHGAPRRDRLRFIRDLQLRFGALLTPFLVLVLLLASETWQVVMALGGFLLLGVDALYLTFKIRRLAEGQ